MAENKPPFHETLSILETFNFHQGRNILELKDEGKPMDPGLLKAVEILEGKREILENPLKNVSEGPTNFEFKKQELKGFRPPKK